MRPAEKKRPGKFSRGARTSFVLMTHRLKLLFALMLGDLLAAFLFEVAHGSVLSPWWI